MESTNSVNEPELNGNYVFFKEQAYTIPEIIEQIAECYSISIYDPENIKNGASPKKSKKRGHKNQTYRTIYQIIKRKMDEIIQSEEIHMPDQQKSKGRKTKYPVDLVNRVVNRELSSYFAKRLNEKEKRDLAEYEERAKKLKEDFENGTYGDFQAELDKQSENMQGTTCEADLQIAAMLQHRKFEILMDIVFNHLIVLNEDKLKADLTIALTFGDNPPEGRDIKAMDDLTDNRKYYKWRTKKLAALLDN